MNNHLTQIPYSVTRKRRQLLNVLMRIILFWWKKDGCHWLHGRAWMNLSRYRSICIVKINGQVIVNSNQRKRHLPCSVSTPEVSKAAADASSGTMCVEAFIMCLFLTLHATHTEPHHCRHSSSSLEAPRGQCLRRCWWWRVCAGHGG